MTTDTTIHIWYKATDLVAEKCLLSKNNINLQDRLRIPLGAADKFYCFKECQNDGTITITGTTTAVAGVWYFVTVRLGSLGFTLSINGTQEASSADIKVLSAGTVSGLLLGLDYGGNTPANGTIGEVIIYNRWQSDSEGRHIHQATKWRYQ